MGEEELIKRRKKKKHVLYYKQIAHMYLYREKNIFSSYLLIFLYQSSLDEK